MNSVFKTKKFSSFIPYLLFALAVIVAYKVINELGFFTGIIKNILSVIAPFFYGFILAYIINMPCDGIQRLLEKTNNGFIVKKKSGFSILIVFALFALIVSIVINLIVPAVSRSVSFFIANFPSYHQNALNIVDNFNALDLFGIYIDIEAIENLFLDMIKKSGVEYFTSSVNALIGVSSAIFKGFLAFISAIYFLIEKEKITGFLCRLLRVFTSANVYDVTTGCADKINKNFRRYIRMQPVIPGRQAYQTP